jgi:hypothetical protein
MHDSPFLDRLRARARGELNPAEQAALERELAADPTLARLGEDFALVHALTALDGAVPASRTRFEALAARLGRQSALRRVAAAAAALLVMTAAGFVLGRWSADGATEPLYLATIELDSHPPLPVLPADLPASWADYDPRGESGVRFLADLGEAELLARAVQRPLLVYGFYPGCPLCVVLDREVFADPDVAALAERLVPVRVNLAELSEAEQRALTARGYPFLEVWRADGTPAHFLTRNADPAVFIESLHDGLASSGAEGEQPPWDGLRAAARSFVSARAAELEGRMAEAERGFRALARDRDVVAPIAARAAAGLERIAADARVILLEARTAAASDPAAAARLLRHALARFAGSSFEADLAAALARLERDGRFPPLAEADRSA